MYHLIPPHRFDNLQHLPMTHTITNFVRQVSLQPLTQFEKQKHVVHTKNTQIAAPLGVCHNYFIEIYSKNPPLQSKK